MGVTSTLIDSERGESSHRKHVYQGFVHCRYGVRVDSAVGAWSGRSVVRAPSMLAFLFCCHFHTSFFSIKKALLSSPGSTILSVRMLGTTILSVRTPGTTILS